MAVYGFKIHKLAGYHTNVEKVVKTSAVIKPGDPVSLENDLLIVSTAGLAIFGTYQGKDNVTGNGTLTASVTCGTDIEYLIDNDNDTNTFAAAGYGAGKFYDMIGTTGAVLVDTSSASTSGQLTCIDQTPDASDTSIGLYKINKAESQF